MKRSGHISAMKKLILLATRLLSGTTTAERKTLSILNGSASVRINGSKSFETIAIDNYQFKVVMADSRKIIQVYVHIPDDAPIPELGNDA